MRLHVYERARRVGGWAHRQTLVARGARTSSTPSARPVPGLELLTP